MRNIALEDIKKNQVLLSSNDRRVQEQGKKFFQKYNQEVKKFLYYEINPPNSAKKGFAL